MALPKFVGNEHEIFEVGDVEDGTVSAGEFGEIGFVSLSGFYLIDRHGILVNASVIPFQHRLPVVIGVSFLQREEPDFRFTGRLRLMATDSRWTKIVSEGMSEQSRRIPGGSSFIIRLLLRVVQFCFQRGMFTIGGTVAVVYLIVFCR